ncbi:MAG: hypothetical protein V1779_01160 [bacterium]
MTQLLLQAWAKLIVLAEDRQESIAYLILEEIQDEILWNRQFENSQVELTTLAQKVRKDISAGRIQ